MSVDHVALRQLVEYHHWATDRLLSALAAASAEVLDRPIGGSFASGRGLLNHIVGVERLWLERWNGSSPTTLPDLSECETVDCFVREWVAVKAAQQRFVRALGDASPGAPLTYTNFRGETWTYPLSEVLLHVVNHGTYHRGQLAHLIRDLGAVPPPTDYLVFLDETAPSR